MSLCEGEWKRINAHPTVLSWIRHGFPLHLTSEPSPCDLPNRVFTPQQQSFVDQEVAELLQRGSIQRVDRSDAHCILPLSVVACKGKKYRLVLDSRHTNLNISCPAYHNEGVNALASQIESGDFLISIDLQRGFHHLQLCPQERRYLCFRWREHIFQWIVLPFGVRSAPYLFCRTVCEVITFFRTRQTRCTVWVDDFIFMIHRDTNFDFHVRWILHVFHHLGWSVNFDKCDLEPTTSTAFVGFDIFSQGAQGPWLRVPFKKIRNLRLLLSNALNVCSLPARGLARIIGKCVSMTRAVLPARILLRNAHRCLASRSSWNDRVVLTEACKADFRWWRDALKTWNGAPLLQRSVDIQLQTDASGIGWGAWLDSNNNASGPWETEVAFQHSNYRELLAVFRSLISMETQVLSKSVQILSDNVTTVAYLNHLAGSNPLFLRLTKTIFQWCTERGVTLTAKHLSGRDNTHADHLSHVLFRHEWQLNPAIFYQIDQLFGPHQVDRFASETTTLLPRYNAIFQDRFCEAVDAFAQDWGSAVNWWNPPLRAFTQSLTENQNRPSLRDTHSTALERGPMVSAATTDGQRSTIGASKSGKSMCSTSRTTRSAKESQMEVVRMEDLWQRRLEQYGWSSSSAHRI